ncbi:MAG: hypothetical protein ACP5MD_16250 [Verrucomicrobiia bacterium]
MMPPDPVSQVGVGGQPANPDAELAALRQSIANLRMLMQLTVIALVVVVASVNVFLFHQVRLLRRQAGDMQSASLEMARAVGEYETNTVPLMERFIADLKKFADRDPSFAQVLAKYPLSSQKTTNAPVATNPPAPATKTSPTKTAHGSKTGTGR